MNQPQKWFCNRCGHPNQPNWNACQMCRTPNPYMQPPKEATNTKLGLLIALFVFMIFCIVCGLSGIISKRNLPKDNVQVTVAKTNPNLPIGATVTNISPSTSSVPNFATSIVCGLPHSVATNSPFARLGGGSWGKWGDSEGELDYGCNGGTSSIKLKDDGNADITAEYGVIGGRETAHYVSVEYTAFQYTGQTQDERQWRRQYADFCDALSQKYYGVKLPDKFKKRLLDESTYSPSGITNGYAVKVGNGYVNLSANKNKTLMIMLDVHFFPSEQDYKTYKDS